jgi:Transposase DDE domain group 1/Rdx family
MTEASGPRIAIRYCTQCQWLLRAAHMRSGSPPTVSYKSGLATCSRRPVGRPPSEVRRSYANFTHRAGTWTRPRRVVAKVEWHPGELYPRVGFIVTNMARRAANVVAFYNKRGTCEQWIKEGKGAIRWTRLSCRSFAANAVRFQLHAFAYNLATSCARSPPPSRSKTGR